MFETSQWLIFLAVTLALIAVPGPAVMFILARSVDGGLRVGIVTAAGIALGNLIHSVVAAYGVSAFIASTAWALATVRYLGAAYLLYLGVSGLLVKVDSNESVRSLESRKRSDFVKGVLVALLNPKVILFLLAFLPQFVVEGSADYSQQLLVLGLVFVGIGWLGDSTWALLASSVANRLKKSSAAAKITRILASTTYILLGLVTAISG